jgi:hypothetical protein
MQIHVSGERQSMRIAFDVTGRYSLGIRSPPFATRHTRGAGQLVPNELRKTSPLRKVSHIAFTLRRNVACAGLERHVLPPPLVRGFRWQRSSAGDCGSLASQMDVEYHFTAGAFEPEVVYGSVITNLIDVDPGVFTSKTELLCDGGQVRDRRGERSSFIGRQANPQNEKAPASQG